MEQKILSLKDDKINSEVELIEYPSELSGGRNLIIQRDLILGYITSAGQYPWGAHPGSEPDNNITTDFIDVSGFDSITLTLFEDVPSPAGIGRMYAYDEQRNPLRLLFSQTSSTFTQKNSIKIEIGADAKYIAATLMKPNVLRYKLEKGSKATDWTPAPEDLGLSYPDFITEFKPSISDRYILTEELIEGQPTSFSNKITANEFIEQ